MSRLLKENQEVVLLLMFECFVLVFKNQMSAKMTLPVLETKNVVPTVALVLALMSPNQRLATCAAESTSVEPMKLVVDVDPPEPAEKEDVRFDALPLLVPLVPKKAVMPFLEMKL